MIFIFSETFGVVRDFMDVFAHVSMCASCFMIVALTCERHFAIDSPHQVSYLSQRLLNRWTSQLDLGSMTGGLERVFSVHNST